MYGQLLVSYKKDDNIMLAFSQLVAHKSIIATPFAHPTLSKAIRGMAFLRKCVAKNLHIFTVRA